MGPRRFGSRPDPSGEARNPVGDASGTVSSGTSGRTPETGRRCRPDGNAWDDPGRLIESWLRDHAPVPCGPETLVLAWLTVLPPAVPPAAAALSLLRRLAPAHAQGVPDDRRRLLDLLAFVAGPRGIADPD